MRLAVLLTLLGWVMVMGFMVTGQEMTVLVHDAQGADVERVGTLKDANSTSADKIAQSMKDKTREIEKKVTATKPLLTPKEAAKKAAPESKKGEAGLKKQVEKPLKKLAKEQIRKAAKKEAKKIEKKAAKSVAQKIVRKAEEKAIRKVS